jgi:ubiquinone/menaquinone biosynthesis C-methylase UbiE
MTRPRIWVLVALFGGALACRAPAASHEATVHHDFADVAHWAAVFDDPARDAWQKPEALVAALGVRPGMVVADLGAGTGYFERRLSAAVGPEGTVFAVDVEPGMVAHLRARAEREGTDNVVPVLASATNPRLPAGAVDLIVIVDTFHHLDDRLRYLGRLKRALRPGGRVAIVDWRKRPEPVGPPPAHKLPRRQVVAEMEAAGYALIEEPDVLPYQYFLIFAPR